MKNVPNQLQFKTDMQLMCQARENSAKPIYVPKARNRWMENASDMVILFESKDVEPFSKAEKVETKEHLVLHIFLDWLR